MKIHCSLSGIEYHTEYIPINIGQGITYHPIFDCSLAELSKLYTAYLNQELKPIEIHLLMCGLLKTSNLVIFRSSLAYEPTAIQTIAAKHIQSLFTAANRFNSLEHPKFIAPAIAITLENNSLAYLPDWLAVWSESYNSFLIGLADQQLADEIRKKEIALEKFIKTPAIPEHKYARILADWACLAACFPREVEREWKQIIIDCYEFDRVINRTSAEIIDVYEHCLLNIESYNQGSLFSGKLFSCFDTGLEQLKGFHAADFSIVQSDTHAALLIAQESLTEPPKREDFPSAIEFLRANLAFKTKPTI